MTATMLIVGNPIDAVEIGSSIVVTGSGPVGFKALKRARVRLLGLDAGRSEEASQTK